MCFENLYFENPYDQDEQPPSSNDYSESGDSDANSDEDDVFEISTLSEGQHPPDYHECFLYRWARTIREVASHMRNDVLLPRDPRERDGAQVYADVQSGASLPAWHCPFVTRTADGRCMPCQAVPSAACKSHSQSGTYEKDA